MNQEYLNHRRVLPALFANSDSADINKVGSSESGFSYHQGIPSMYSIRTGKKVNRADMNGLGRLISQAGIFNQFGGYYTFDSAVSNAIGGYPIGAILYYKDTTSGKVRLVRSLIENNENNFVEDPSLINNIVWSFVDEVLPVTFRPRIYLKDNPYAEGTLQVNSTELFIPYDSMLIIQSGVGESSASGIIYNDPSTTNEMDDDSSDSSDAPDDSSYSSAAPDDSSDDSDISIQPVVNDITGDGSIPESSRITIFAKVRHLNETEYHDGACLGCIFPVTEAYDIYAEVLDAEMTAAFKPSPIYASSPVQLYLHAGDWITLTSSLPCGSLFYKFELFELIA